MARWRAALRRAGYLFSLAILFRVQLWLFAYPQSSWTNLFKVDILNCMGFAIALMSIMAIFTTAERVRLCAVLGVLIAAVAPLVSSMNLTLLPQELAAYIVPSTQYFDETNRSEEHTSELQSHLNLVCRLLLEKKKHTKLVMKLM